MEEDKNIKILLQEYGVEKTSSSFNNKVMQKINAAVITKQAKPLLNPFIVNLLKIIFSLVIIALVICLVFLPLKNLPVTFSININGNIYKQLFSFILTFWIGMFMNLWLNKRWSKKTILYNY
jgi:hypothetical protein